ncbi:MAG: DUF2061 domain-containing protein [bacterium]
MDLNFLKPKEELYSRTFIKGVVYRISHLTSLTIISQLYGASAGQSSLMILTVILVGLIIYYTHDRLWLLFGWDRNSGNDTVFRSAVKTITYRIITFFATVFLLGMLIMGASFTKSLSFSITDQIIAISLFFIIERIFNAIEWGKIPNTI